MSRGYQDQGYFRRKFPRRPLVQRVGVLSRGKYFIAETSEIGEGGMSLNTEFVLNNDSQIVVNFQIPDGEFVSVRAVVKSTSKAGSSHVSHGISFDQLQFGHRRQIRTFVSARQSDQENISTSR
ncbi:MAG: PilZ domain-containing protein [Bdellovibrionaceae bacterium]|nr:PilZ domain-containing protein [Pseudobdellovibrionaceae bacterium]